MPRPPPQKWAFAPRFRRRAFGWRSQPAVQRVKEAAAEIRKATRKDPALAAAGEVLFLVKVSPALEQVDNSSGAIGTAVNDAIGACAKIIGEAPVDDDTRDRWLERLWEAHQNDAIPYIERLGDYWGELCASRERASEWADRLIGTVEMVWGPNRKPGGYFHGTIARLSALFRAGRHDELLALIETAPYAMWHYREWGVKALAAMGRKAEAIRYAEASHGLNVNPIAIARACEENLLSSGFADEGGQRLRNDKSAVRRRSRPSGTALDRCRIRLRDHRSRCAVGLFERHRSGEAFRRRGRGRKPHSRISLRADISLEGFRGQRGQVASHRLAAAGGGRGA